MDSVMLDVGPVGLADRACGGLGGVGRTHQVAVPLDRVLALQREDHDGPRGHEAAQAVEEGPLLVHVVKAFGLGLGQPHHLDRDRDQARLLVTLEDGPDQMVAHGVRLDDGERAFNHARMIPETAAKRKEGRNWLLFSSLYWLSEVIGRRSTRHTCPSFTTSKLL